VGVSQFFDLVDHDKVRAWGLRPALTACLDRLP
jgi:hypothetical protein